MPPRDQFDLSADDRVRTVPPHSWEAERSVLGALLMDNGLWEMVEDSLVVEDDFYSADHQKIFARIGELRAQSKPADLITVSKALTDNSMLDEVGGLEYLTGLTEVPAAAGNMKAYLNIIRDAAILRKLISELNVILETAYHPADKDPREIVDLAEGRIMKVTDRYLQSLGQIRELGYYSDIVIKYVDRLSENPGEPIGLATGFTDIDGMTSGLQDGELAIIAARPSMGKTALALNIARNVACSKGGPNAVLFFSMEMSGDQLTMRLLCSEAKINHHALRRGQLGDDGMQRMFGTLGKVEKWPIYMDDSSTLSVLELRSKARRLQRKLKADGKKLAMVMVDYLQLMGEASDRVDNRAMEVSQISRGLKALAKELNLPVVALSQLNRSLENRPNRRPVLSDLRESGAIEQDADLILFIYRDDHYNEDSKNKGVAEIIIGKQRNGPIGTVRLAFQSNTTTFSNLARAYED